MEMENDEWHELLQISKSQLQDIIHFCNHFPNIDLVYEVLDGDDVRPGENVTLQFTLELDFEGREGRSEVRPVDAPRYPKAKEEGWWLVVGDSKSQQLLVIKRVSLQWRAKVKLDFTAPAEVGKKSYMLYFMYDSYLGCDQEYSFTIDVRDAAESD